MLEKNGFKKIMVEIGIACNKELTKEQLSIYHKVLSMRFSDNSELAVKSLEVLANHKISNTFPTIAQFCDTINTFDNIIQLEINSIIKALKDAGSHRSVAFTPTTNLIIKNKGGWIKFCSLTQEEHEEFFKWDFPKSYKALKSADVDKPIKLIGSHEATGNTENLLMFVVDKEGVNISEQLEFDKTKKTSVLTVLTL